MSKSNGHLPPYSADNSHHPPLPPPNTRVPFASLLLSRTDRIRLIGFPENVVPAVHEAISRVWLAGIQAQGPARLGGWEWKLSGNPWSGYGHEAVPCRRLLIHILHAFYSLGWHLVMATDMSKKGFDMIFKPGPPVQRYFFAISFNETDKIRLIDSPNPHVLCDFIAAVQTWPLGIQDSREKEPNCHHMKLKGNPWWTSDGVEVNHARLTACAILSAMDANGFELVGSVDMSVGRSKEHQDLDTWFFGNKLGL